MGPQSYWKLTPAEIRVYAEGLKTRSDSQEQDAAYASTKDGEPSYNKKSKRRRDNAALNRVDQRIKAKQSNRSSTTDVR